jgi:hypothetical protein
MGHGLIGWRGDVTRLRADLGHRPHGRVGRAGRGRGGRGKADWTKILVG